MTNKTIIQPGFLQLGEEELALAREGGACERAALGRRLGLTKVQGESDDNQTGRQQARQILDAAAAANPKKIAKTDLQRAVALYAGPQATNRERAAVASKVMEFLSKRQIAIAT